MKRHHILDQIRGLTLISMILFHAVWDLVYIFDRDWTWFYSPLAYVWQQSICWLFIALSGFCWSLGRHKLRRGLIVSGAGFLVSLVTELVMPDQRIRFGVLTLLGFCMLVMIPLEKLLSKIPSWAGLFGSFLSFLLIRNINDGYLGFEGLRFAKLPDNLYHMGDIATFVGFTDTRFYSTDYFSVFPWIFLFITGYYAYRLAMQYGLLEKLSEWKPKGKLLGFMGRKSLIIYMLHQPVIYLILFVWDKIS